MPRIESYTSDKIDTLLAAEVSSRNVAISTAISTEAARADAVSKASDYVVVRSAGTQADIQSVLNQAETTGGGSVTVPKGVWLITSPILVPSNITLNLSPGAIIRRNASGVNNLIRNKSNGVTGGYTANQDIIINGGEWDGNSSLFTSSCVLMAFGHCNNVKIMNGEFYGITAGNHIRFGAASNITVDNNTFRNYLGTEDMVRIEGAYQPGATAAFPFFGPQDNTPCENMEITNNSFITASYAIGSRTSVSGHKNRSIRIIGNHFFGITVIAIRMLDWEYSIIDGNTFDTCDVGINGYTGVNQICAYFTISSNVFRNLTDTGIKMDGSTASARYIRRITYTGNIIVSGDNYGIYDLFTSNVSYNGNHVSSCGIIGIKIAGVVNFSLVGNHVTGNNTTANANGADIKLGDNAVQVLANETNNGTIVGNTIEELFIRTATEVITADNHITTYTLSATAPAPTEIYKRNNFIAGVFSAT